MDVCAVHAYIVRFAAQSKRTVLGAVLIIGSVRYMAKLLAVLTVLLLLPGTATSQTLVASADPVLQPGDSLHITVWRMPELSGGFIVASDGTVRHPLYQNVKVAGVPIAEAEDRIREFLRRFETDPQVSIDPLLRVGVSGEVRLPNLYALSPEATLAQAVAIAGPTERGRLDRVRLLRDGQEYFLDLTDTESNVAQLRIQSGDQLWVERRISIWRDYVAPAGSISSAIIGLINLILR